MTTDPRTSVMAEPNVEHLKMIQGVITRMASNSFLLKGWCVTLVAALLVLATKDADKEAAKLFVSVGWFPVLVFASLDMYYLWQERLFRALYRKALAGEVALYSLDTTPVRNEHFYVGSFLSPSIWLFYVFGLGIIPYVLALILYSKPG